VLLVESIVQGTPAVKWMANPGRRRDVRSSETTSWPSSMTTSSEASRVLVVDDNLDLAGLMSMVLAHHGFQVATAPNGHAAIETARSFRPQVVLLDIGLPDMDGYQVAQTLRRDVGLEKATYIAISAYDLNSRPFRARESRFDHFLVKPVDLERLIALLSRARLGRT
jgi:CheY-like chemotaxis protein